MTGRYLFLTIKDSIAVRESLVIVVVGYHSLENREFREGESDRLNERERMVLRHL
jgi:hypothetical protein